MNYIIDPPAVTTLSAFALGLSAPIGKLWQRMEYYAGSRA